ncbi:hypothetical protein VP01_98g2 [Puccinia sorghi]|uniref:tRNA (guanine(9)-N1)-methyltransferase n=1 Tax=Puccinia sorghi TaxID=27349 RepID=A0A0L6U5F8_9BASI|nr:hypothetical protein VP01_98g2 [Puccinia sorghi]
MESTEQENKPSKKQLKRQLKRQLVLEQRPAKRAAERARKKQKKLEPGQEPKTRNHEAAIVFPAIIALDCRFDDKMSDKEIVSLDRQIAHSYSINRKAPVQFEQLNGNQYLRWKSVQFATESIEEITQQDVGSTDQDVGAGSVSEEKRPEDQRARSIVASSTSNSEGTEPTGKECVHQSASGADIQARREEVREEGGSQQREDGSGNLCLDLAQQHGFQHAQLPINQHFSHLKTRKVLTVNQVVEILVSYLHDQDWEKSFQRVIPARKL